MQETLDQPEGIYEDDGDWYGISPSENPEGDQPKYPLNSCNDVKDAWNLRSHGTYSVEQSTLEARIKRVGDSKGCSDATKPWTDNKDIDLDDTDYEIVPDCDSCPDNDITDTNNMSEFEFELDDLTPEAAIDRLAEEHEGVEAVVDELDELRELKESVDEVTEEIGLDLDELVDEYEELQAKADAYDEIEAEQMEEDAERLAEMTDKYGDAEEVLDAFDSHEDIEERIDLLEGVVETETSETTTDSGGDDETPEERVRTKRIEPDAWK